MAINWKVYPPAGAEARLGRYSRYEALFLAQHADVFKVKTGGKYQLLRYITANFAGMLSTLCADMLVGEPPDFTVADETNTGALEAVGRLVKENDLVVLAYEAALAGSFRGDMLLKARWGLRTPQSEKPEALIEEVPVTIYFPEFSEDNVRQVVRASLAWLKADPFDPKRQLVRVEEHEPGIIRNRLFRLSPNTQEAEEIEITYLPEYVDLPAEVETGLTEIPLYHVPNFRYGSRFWGISDYQGLESLIEALNNRMSMVDTVLDKHVAPRLVAPPSMLDEDGKLQLDKLDVIIKEPGEDDVKYLTWDAQLTAAFSYIDRLMELLFILSETGPSIFGLDKFGIAASGTALRLRLIRTVAKINRKRLYFDRGLKAVLYAAQQLEQIHGGAGYEPAPVSIQWADGLPEDLDQLTRQESLRRAAGNTSIESSIRRLDGPEAVDAEMERIAEEQEQEAALLGTRTVPTNGGASDGGQP